MKSEYGGFGERFFAVLIDIFILSAIFLLVFAMAAVSYSFALRAGIDAIIVSAETQEILKIGATIALLASRHVYEIYFIGKYGATYGKKWTGLKVVGSRGEVIGYKRAFIRALGRIVVMFTMQAGYLLIPFTKHKQGLHDFIAGTYVIRKKVKF